MNDAVAQPLLEKNLEFFKTHQTALYDRLMELGAPKSKLVQVGADDWDIEFRGVRLYQDGAKAFAQRQINESPPWFRLFTSRAGTQSVDEHAGKFLASLHRNMEEHGIVAATNPTSSSGYYAIVFGIGLAEHLRKIIDRVDCRQLILVEPNIEFLLHSLSTFDWREFIEFTREKEITVYWVWSDRDLVICNNVRSIIRNYNPVRLDGTWLYTHYHNAQMDAAKRMFLAETNVLLSGLGWLDDEILMIKNSHANLKDGTATIFRKSDAVRAWPVFIVGSGPSIDKDIDVIKANADKALVIACGTGLGPLLRHGIRPDLYVELENLPQSHTFLQSVVAEYSLEGITLLATTTIDPRIGPMFDRVIWFMRDGLASFPVFCQDTATELPFVNPTVSNTGFAFGLAAGFKEFYFFGIDLGSKDPKRHHSKETPYMKGVLPFENPMDHRLPGNFGGEVFADSVFIWAHDSYEKVIALKRAGHRFYNCSDGALIKGATPKIARSVKLAPQAESKERMLDELYGSYRPYGVETFGKAWSAEDHFAEVGAFRDKLLAFCAEDDEKDRLGYVNNIIRFLNGAYPTKASHHYFRGTLMLAFLSGIHFLNRVPDDKLDEMHSILLDETITLIHGIHDRVVSQLSYLAEQAEAS